MDGIPKAACEESNLELEKRLSAAVFLTAPVIEEYIYEIAAGEALNPRLDRDYEREPELQ